MVDEDKKPGKNDSTMLLAGQMGHRLQAGEMLNKKYRIERVLGEGGFGITYLARDTVLDMNVAVKEYFPTGYATRDVGRTNKVVAFTGEKGEEYDRGKQRFLREARTLARLTGLQGIVGIHDFFEENGTAYIVMEYLNGVTLRRYLEQMPGGKISLERALELLRPVISSLIKVHEQGLIHRDISPDNIMVMNGKEVKLLDFGTAREVVAGPKSMSVMLKPGYAPEEQYRSHGGQGTWTDVYAVSGTIYRCITGERPVEAPDRIRKDTIRKPSEMGVSIPEETEKVLMQGLAIYSENRIQDMQVLYEGLYGSYGTRLGVVRSEEPSSSDEQSPSDEKEASDTIEKTGANVSEPETTEENMSVEADVTDETGFADNTATEDKTGEDKSAVALKPWMIPAAAVVIIALIGVAYFAGMNRGTGKIDTTNVAVKEDTKDDNSSDKTSADDKSTADTDDQKTGDDTEETGIADTDTASGVVTFSNPQIEKAACAALGKEEGSVIYTDELKNVHSIILCRDRVFADWEEHNQYHESDWQDFYNEEMVRDEPDLSDLSLFPNLYDLVLENQGMYDLEALKGLPLERLGLRRNKNLRDISALEGFDRLNYLDLQCCERLSDVAVLANLPIEQLFVDETMVSDFSFLEGMPYLEQLWANDMDEEDLAILLKKTEMRFICLKRYRGPSLDVSMFKDLKWLFGLELMECPKLTSIEGIGEFTQLSYFNIEGTNVTDLSPVKDILRLDNLRIQHCRIKDYSVIKEIPTLQHLAIDRSQVEAIEALGLEGVDIEITD